MPNVIHHKALLRIIDANANRALEGLRVCEEITRFVLEDRASTGKLKNIRHAIAQLITTLETKQKLLHARNSRSDIGKNIFARELTRSSLYDIFFANIQRAKESIRSLEEFSKLLSRQHATGFKDIRYSLYQIEKYTTNKIFSLKNSNHDKH